MDRLHAPSALETDLAPLALPQACEGSNPISRDLNGPTGVCLWKACDSFFLSNKQTGGNPSEGSMVRIHSGPPSFSSLRALAKISAQFSTCDFLPVLLLVLCPTPH
jgi:hypothetical protein